MEYRESYESLEDALDLQDRLGLAKEPLEVIAVVSEAVRHLGYPCNGESPQRLEINLTDSLQDIYAQVTALYKEFIIPRDYDWWWEDAKKELDEKKQLYSDALKKLRTMPSQTEEQRREVMDIQFGAADYYVSYEEHKKSVNEPLTFTAWKQKMEGSVQKIIDDCDRVRRRLAANAPARTSQDAFQG